MKLSQESSIYFEDCTVHVRTHTELVPVRAMEEVIPGGESKSHQVLAAQFKILLVQELKVSPEAWRKCGRRGPNELRLRKPAALDCQRAEGQGKHLPFIREHWEVSMSFKPGEAS